MGLGCKVQCAHQLDTGNCLAMFTCTTGSWNSKITGYLDPCVARGKGFLTKSLET